MGLITLDIYGLDLIDYSSRCNLSSLVIVSCMILMSSVQAYLSYEEFYIGLRYFGLFKSWLLVSFFFVTYLHIIVFRDSRHEEQIIVFTHMSRRGNCGVRMHICNDSDSCGFCGWFPTRIFSFIYVFFIPFSFYILGSSFFLLPSLSYFLGKIP